MSALLRIVAVFLAALVVLAAAASRVVDQTRLPAEAVVAGASLVQPFGCTALALEPFDPFCPTRHVHTGIDLAARLGAAIRSATGGIAVVGYDGRACGLYVAISFDDRVRILYCHLLRAVVRPGAAVIPGEVIGQVGASGLATGAHLHLEVQVDGRAVDPVAWLAAPGA